MFQALKMCFFFVWWYQTPTSRNTFVWRIYPIDNWGANQILGKLTDISLSATKKAGSKRMIAHLTDLFTCTDTLPIQNSIISLLRFHLCVNAVSGGTISKLESIATRFLKNWLSCLIVPLGLHYTTQEFVVPVLLMCPGRQSLACCLH